MRIAIDAGHGLYTPGKRCLASIDPNVTREWVLNDRIASRQEVLLRKYEGVETLRLDDVTGESDVPLNIRVNKATVWGAEWLISNHHNAGIGGGKGGGMVVFTYLTSNNAEKAMQRAIYEECVARGGLTGRSKPLARGNFAMVRDPKCNALLIEYGFMDSLTDTPVILTDEYAEAMAQGTVAAIAKQLNLKKKQEDFPMTAEEKLAFDALKKRVDELENENKVYHYASELPDWARPTITALFLGGVFKGAGPGDLDLPKDMMRILFINARSGLYGDKYKNL